MKIVCAISTLLLTVHLAVSGEQKDVVRIGVNGASGILVVDDLNALAKAWLGAKDDSSSSDVFQVSHPGVGIPFNIEYGFQPFLYVTLWDIWEIGCKFDFLYLAQLYSSMSKDTIRIDTRTYIPALGTSLRLGIFELCADALYGVSRVNWEDNFFGYNSRWNSKALGYEIKAGLASSLGKFFGFSFSAGYRGLVFKNVYDHAGRKLYITQTNKPFTLNMSGLVVNTGLYLSYTSKKDRSK